MAYFKISLLTPRINNQKTYFLEDIITEFDTETDNILDLNDVDTKDLYDTHNNDYHDLLVINNKRAKHNTSYTYNEKISFSQNAQKTLTFDLNRYVLKENEWTENPFSHLLTEGTQLLVIDQYKNEYFFTVTSTNFNIRENNIVYNISCQDSFSYQVSRQNDGYTIDNNPEEADFIGAKTVDWWVLKKIVPECYLTNYIYLSCNTGLYEDKDGIYHTFKNNESIFNVKRIIKEAHTPPVYDMDGSIIKENDIDYFDKISFSCSGVNANAALIQLGEQIKMQIATFEHAQLQKQNNQIIRTNYFDRYFWFEPMKNDQRIGLTYSPTHNIKNFDLTHQGQSLTTVLNVDGPTYNDEIITLLPDVPEFFLTYFNSSDWAEGSYTPGLFSQLCKNRVFTNTTDSSYTDKEYNNSEYFMAQTGPEHIQFLVGNNWVNRFDQGEATHIRFPIYSCLKNGDYLFSVPPYYTGMNFRLVDESDNTKRLLISNIIINKSNGNISELVTANTHTWKLMYVSKNWKIINETSGDEKITNKSLRDIKDLSNTQGNTVTIGKDGFYYINNKITNISIMELPYSDNDSLSCELISNKPVDVEENISEIQTNTRDIYCYIVIDYPVSSEEVSAFSITQPQLYINFFRNFTKEEIEFAKIADACPWLENKLIDFNYFKNSNIISKNEYDELMNIILNQLRRVNGSLMFYARGYYKALQERTKLLAELLNNLDSLGAACQAAVVDPMATKGRTSEDNRQYFDNAYSLLINAPWRKKALLRYDDVVTDYFNKYFNSQQRFLKNIYNFRQYFNAPYISNIPDIYGYKLNIVNNYNSDVFYTFDQTVWSKVNENFRDYAGAGAPNPGAEDYQPDNESLNNYGQPYYTIYRFFSTGNKYVPQPIASKDQLGETLYVLPEMSNNKYFCNNEDIYKDIQYGQVVFKIPAWRTDEDEDENYEYHLGTAQGPCISKGGTRYNYTGPTADVSNFTDEEAAWDGAFMLEVVPKEDTTKTIKLLCWASSFTLIDSEHGEGYYYFYQLRQGMYTEEDPVGSNKIKAGLLGPENLIQRLSPNGSISPLKITIYRIKGEKVEKIFKSTSKYIFETGNTKIIIDPSVDEHYKEKKLEIVNASKKDLIENWILNQTDYSNILRRITPIYSNFPDEVAQYSDGKMTDWVALTELANICYKSILTIEKDDEDNDDDKESMWKKDGKTLKDKARRLYYKNLPITDAYKLLPQFRYEEEVDSHGNVSYLFKQVNKAGQSIKNYIDYKSGKSAIPALNPYDEDQQVMARVPYVTPLNEGSFYRKVMHTPKANYAWFAWLLIPPVPGSLITRAAIAMTVAHYTTYYNWDLEGDSARDIYHNRTDWKWSGYWDRIDKIYKSYDKTPNDQKDLKNLIYPMYTISSDTMEKVDEYINAINTATYQQLSEGNFSNPRTFLAEEWNDSFLRIPIQNCEVKTEGGQTSVSITYDSGILNFINGTNRDPFEMFALSNAVKAFKATNIGYTFRDISADAQFIDTIYEPLKLDSTLYKNDRYTMIVIQTANDDVFKQEGGWDETLNNIISSHVEQGLSGTLYYPLINQMIPLDTSAFDWDKAETKNTTTVRELLLNSGRSIYTSGYDYVIRYDDVYILLFRARDYKTEKMNVIYNDFIKNYSNQYKWYDKRTHDAYNFSAEPGLANGFYRMPDVSIDLEKTKSTDIFNILTGEYYTIDGERIYTIKQLPLLDYSCYYIKALQKDLEYASENQIKFPVTIIRNTKIWDQNKQSLLKIEKEELNSCYELDFKNGTSTSSSIEGYINWIEKTFTIGTYTVTIQRGRTEDPVVNLKGLTNGSFWYYYHHAIERPLLFEQAAAIETQLTEYWTNAYYASKGCEYFLPEYWTESANQENNFFNKNIYVVRDNVAILSNYYLPEVKVYTTKENNAISPQYHFFYRSSDTTVDDIYKNDITDDETIFNANTIINKNSAYYYAFRRLMPEDSKESNYWLAEQIGSTTYYYVDNINSGMLWEDFVGDALKKPNAYQEMSGNYVMGYRLLRKYYYNNNFTQYKAYQKQHDQIWKTLYENYGFLILENSYKSETATNSQDLLTTASLYFEDRKIPERAYNINIIDTASLEKYDGAEIRIGDGIKINAQEYYDEYDLVYQSLSQYLFITDISYTLRNTADINLTVNNVKYEEGIIKRLAKLIK